MNTLKLRHTTTLLMGALLLGACGQTPTAKIDPLTTSSLILTIEGAPAEGGNVTLTGPDNYLKTFKNSANLSGLKPGTYTITAGEVNSGAYQYSVSADKPSATLEAGLSSELKVTYTRKDITLSVSPNRLSVLPGQQVNLSAKLANSNDVNVTWASNGGSLIPGGSVAMFTAPSIPGTYTVTVKSAAVPEVQATADLTVPAEAPMWVTQHGGGAADIVRTSTTDPQGNTFLGGLTSSGLDGPARGNWDGFLSKFGPDGQVRWTRQFGGSGSDQVVKVTADAAGNVYAAGFVAGVAFDGSTTAKGSNDMVFVKYDPNGDVVWAKQYGLSGSDYGREVILDTQGNVYLIGFTGSKLFGAHAGGWDITVVKLDPDGNQLWAEQYGTAQNDDPRGVAVGANDELYLLSNVVTNASAGYDMVLRRIAPDGQVLATSTLGTAQDDLGEHMAIAGDGTLYVVGSTFGDFGGVSGGKQDAFLAALNANGSLRWVKQWGGAMDDVANGVQVTTNGEVLVVGAQDGDRDRHRAEISIPSSSGTTSWDAYAVKFDPQGNFVWQEPRLLSTANVDVLAGVGVDSTGNVYVGGYTQQKLGAQSYGTWDMIVAKYRP